MTFRERLTMGQPQAIQSMKGYIGWVFLVYFITLIVLSIAIHFIFSSAQHNMAMIADIIAISVAASFVCRRFDKRLQRSMFYSEYRRLLWGFIWTTVVFQLLVACLGLMAVKVNFSDSGLVVAVLTAMLIAVALHVLAVWLLLRITVKNYWKKRQILSKKAH